MIHSFLMIGQSNMAGRGIISEVEPIENKRIKVLRNGRWQPMYVPVNGDRPFSGINLAESFADAYSKEHDVDVGLIPCADGGTSMQQWQPGSLLFDHAVAQARLASRTSTIAGVLWHQGESDCSEKCYTLYEERLIVTLGALCSELELHDVPVLLGGLGDYLADFKGDEDISKNYVYVNAALMRVADKLNMAAFVPATGLGANSDNLHFSATALREFGLRYYAKFSEKEDKNKVFYEKKHPDDALRTALESL